MPSKKQSRKAKIKPQPRPRPAPKPLEPSVVLQSQHSFDLVHTAIAATMFEVIFARKVFPICTKWHKRFYNPTNPDTSYETFVSGDQVVQQGRGLEWHVPATGQFLVLDKLMDALENGVKDALAKSYLRKLDLSFHSIGTEPMCATNCIESYGLHISYGSANMPCIDTQLRDSQGSHTTAMNVLDGKTSLKAMVNGIAHHFLSSEQAKVFKALPLPDNIRVSLQAEYTSQTPPDYQPLGFKPVREILWNKDDKSLNKDSKYQLETNFHSVAFSFRPPGFQALTTQSSRQDGELSKDIARTADESASKARLFNSLRAVNRLRASSQFSASDGEHTQPEVLRQVQGIHFSRLDHDSRQDTQQYHTSSPISASVQPSSGATFNAELYIPQYTPEILDVAKFKLRNLVSGEHDNLDNPHSIRINCECGVYERDSHLVQCLQCHDFHHAECYGYLSNVPRAEFCYACARNLFDKSLNLGDRKFDCQLRRAIRYFQNGQSERTLDEIATHLGMGADERSKSVTRQILDDLATDGYIVESSVDSTFVLVPGKESVIPSTFFNPRIGIYHFFDGNDSPWVDGTGLFRSVEGPDSSVNNSSFPEIPLTPTASYPPKQYRTLRTMQNSSRREVSVDDATTQSAISTPAQLENYTSRGRSFNSEFRTMKLDGSSNGCCHPTLSDADILKEDSGNKRFAQPGQQGRMSRRKMHR